MFVIYCCFHFLPCIRTLRNDKYLIEFLLSETHEKQQQRNQWKSKLAFGNLSWKPSGNDLIVLTSLVELTLSSSFGAFLFPDQRIYAAEIFNGNLSRDQATFKISTFSISLYKITLNWKPKRFSKKKFYLQLWVLK